MMQTSLHNPTKCSWYELHQGSCVLEVQRTERDGVTIYLDTEDLPVVRSMIRQLRKIEMVLAAPKPQREETA